MHVHDCRLNAVREVCVRCPLVMSQDLLSDLAGYKNISGQRCCDGCNVTDTALPLCQT